MNRERNVVAWKFVFYISSPAYAKELYRVNYTEDFINNPNVLDTSLSVYLGPYANTSVKDFSIAPSGTTGFVHRELKKSPSTPNYLADVAGLTDGFYRVRLLLEKDRCCGSK